MLAMSLPPSQKKATAATIPQPKQIKFVSTDGLPQTKRRRVTAACRTCRKRKTKCTGEQPVCQTCTDCGHTCLGYSDPPNYSQGNSRPKPSSYSSKASGSQPKENKPSDLSQSGVVPNAKATEDSLPNTQRAPQLEDGQSRRPGTAGPARAPAALESPQSNRSALISSNRTHVPYFRYFGPTAIVPGFKQMVVRVREKRKSNPSLSTDSSASVRSPTTSFKGSVLRTVAETRPSHSIHFYDPEDNLPNSELVTHLCEVFFNHVGSCFPCLQRDRFLRELAEKSLEPILVDAVCAVAARFSMHPLLRSEVGDKNDFPRHGDVFAHRAMCAVVDALACPTLAVVQACLLLAWEEFGSNRDSGLWMYLGIAIRMAQDLGMQKLEGLRYRYGRVGLAPKHVRSDPTTNFNENQQSDSPEPPDDVEEGDQDERIRERARVDTFWCIFFLDRVISSGTGRPVTLRDDDVEIFFPLQSESTLPNGWPAPFPALMRVIHLYGRITDLLNSIKEVKHVTPEKLQLLAGMESNLTEIYQRLPLKLHFNAVNFQNYAKAGEGTNFLLLHFWFHTLIVLLHQPTLLHSFSGRIQQLFPNSRELSMSSAKTIADILAFVELIDPKSFLSTPFSSQCIYIAACAFLMESAYYSQPSSQSESPPPESSSTRQAADLTIPQIESTSPGRNSIAKHSLLAAVAKENYQRCYKALKSLETYWAGIKYIITVLDQKAKGIGDPLLYTAEEIDSTIEDSPVLKPTLGPPGWKLSQLPTFGPPDDHSHKTEIPLQAETVVSGGTAPAIDPSQAIGWALTGDTHSSQPNLSFLYQLPTEQASSVSYPTTQTDSLQNDSYQPLLSHNPQAGFNDTGSYTQYQTESPYSFSRPASQTTLQNVSGYANLTSPDGSPSAAGYNFVSPPNITSQNSHGSGLQGSLRHTNSDLSSPYHYSAHSTTSGHPGSRPLPLGYANTLGTAHGVTIQTQDINVNAIQDQNGLPLTFSGEFIPWLEYLPRDVINYFGDHQPYRPMVNSDDPRDDKSGVSG
ncbi:hypothetical protein VTO42DRAFT_2628 [Malbranchea cinnamomea]